MGVPLGGTYREIFNSDSKYYNGSNLGNAQHVTAQQPGCHDRPYGLRITLPPLAAVMFKPQREG